jgi:hypothetical protein
LAQGYQRPAAGEIGLAEGPLLGRMDSIDAAKSSSVE